MIEIESVKIKIGKKVVEVKKDEADLVKLLEVVGKKPPVYIPYPYYPYYPYQPHPWYPDWSDSTDVTGWKEFEGTFTSYSSDNITLTGENTGNA